MWASSPILHRQVLGGFVNVRDLLSSAKSPVSLVDTRDPQESFHGRRRDVGGLELLESRVARMAGVEAADGVAHGRTRHWQPSGSSSHAVTGVTWTTADFANLACINSEVKEGCCRGYAAFVVVKREYLGRERRFLGW
jgi:hypothetical protein